MSGSTTVNHQLCLYRVPSLFAWIEYLFSFIIDRSWNWLFCRIDKSKKAWRKVSFNFFGGVCNLFFVLLYNFCGSGKHFLIIFNIQYFVCLYKRCSSDPNQIKSQLMHMLCKDDNKPKSLQIYLLNQVWKVCLHLYRSLSIVFYFW
jgi:hypothetical protein